MITTGNIVKLEMLNTWCQYSGSYSIIKYITKHLLLVLFWRHLHGKLICLLLALNECYFNSHWIFQCFTESVSLC